MSNDKQSSSAGVIQTLEEKRWQDTLQALESVSQGKVVDGEKIHEWLESWGTDNELGVPKI